MVSSLGSAIPRAKGGALDFEMGGGVRGKAPNLGSKEQIWAKIGAKELQF